MALLKGSVSNLERKLDGLRTGACGGAVQPKRKELKFSILEHFKSFDTALDEQGKSELVSRTRT